MKLFSQLDIGSTTLKNRIVMAPMTRCRAIDNVPNDLMASYYASRADAGLLITEGTSPSPNGLGYARIPGLYSEAQIAGWKKVTDAVHEKGGKIFAQIMHTGRISHAENMEAGTEILAPSAIAADGEMFTDSQGMLKLPVPKEMTADDIVQAREEFVQAAKNAIEAGFDGVELHAANGYLLNQFIDPVSNQRTDEYGGSPENRNRFVLETAAAVVEAIGAERTGIRISPYTVYNSMSVFDDLEETYEMLAKEIGKLGLLYIHVVDNFSLEQPLVPDTMYQKIRGAFEGVIIASGGLTKEKAEHFLQSGFAELVAFGQAFLANPDLVRRFKEDQELNAIDYDTFFSPGEKGYTDYPLVEESSVL